MWPGAWAEGKTGGHEVEPQHNWRADHGTVCGKAQTQEVVSQSSFYSVNDPRLHFGSGEATIANLEIRWPNDGKEILQRVAADRFMTVREELGIVDANESGHNPWELAKVIAGESGAGHHGSIPGFLFGHFPTLGYQAGSDIVAAAVHVDHTTGHHAQISSHIGFLVILGMLYAVKCLLVIATAFLGLLCTSASAQQWEKYMESGQQAREAQHLSEAEKQFKAAIREAHNSGGKKRQLAESLDGLAAVYWDQNKYSKSEALYKKSLSIKETVLGPWHLSVAATLDDLGGVLVSAGKNDRAEPFYKRAREIRDRALALHPDVYVDGVPKPVLRPK